MLLERDSAESLYRQLQRRLRQAIATEELPGGTRLPSTRDLARILGVSRNTVLYAYEALASEGYLTGRIGSGTWVAATTRRLRRIDLRRILRDSHFPSRAVVVHDPDGHRLVLHR